LFFHFLFFTGARIFPERSSLPEGKLSKQHLHEFFSRGGGMGAFKCMGLNLREKLRAPPPTD
jgi:hypothetical protein